MKDEKNVEIVEETTVENKKTKWIELNWLDFTWLLEYGEEQLTC